MCTAFDRFGDLSNLDRIPSSLSAGKKALQAVSGFDWLWIRLCERKDIALRLLRSSIVGHYCAYADPPTNPMLATRATYV